MRQAAGQLDLQRPEGSLVQQVGEGEVGRNINTRPLTQAFPHRSVYLPVIRGLLPEFLMVFDFPEPSNPNAARSVTNVPTQSLFLMNSPFVLQQSEAAAARVCHAVSDPRQRVDSLWLNCLSRLPTEAERTMALAFVADWQASGGQTADGADKEAEPVADDGGGGAWSALAQSLLGSAEFRFLD